MKTIDELFNATDELQGNVAELFKANVLKDVEECLIDIAEGIIENKREKAFTHETIELATIYHSLTILSLRLESLAYDIKTMEKKNE